MSWREFEEEAPELVSLGFRLLNGKIAYLGTIKDDGSPRLHPVRPFVGAGGVFVFIDKSSPKRSDLLRDERYALHSAVSDDDVPLQEFLVTGSARLVSDAHTRKAAEALTGAPVPARYVLFEMHVAYVLVSEYDDRKQAHRRRWVKDAPAD
jgi:hypothetical protein